MSLKSPLSYSEGYYCSFDMKNSLGRMLKTIEEAKANSFHSFR